MMDFTADEIEPKDVVPRANTGLLSPPGFPKASTFRGASRGNVGINSYRAGPGHT
jgi:hypothetical protein